MKLPLFYPVLDTALLARLDIPATAAAEALLSAGARILQLRHKGHFSRQVFAEAQAIARLSAAVGAWFVINDRADMAALLHAGVHVGQDDLPPLTVRKLVGDAIIGFSTHNEAQLRAAADQPADYLALGPVFATASKENPDPVLGLAEFRRLRPLTDKPVVAIGGITLDTALSVLQAGADSVAVIGGLIPEAPGQLRSRGEEWIRLLKK